MKRREFMALSSAAVASMALGGSLPARQQRVSLAGGLGSRAAAKGLFYGSSVKSGVLAKDPDFAAAIASECSVIVPETAFKWDMIHPRPDGFDFAAADTFLQFADARGLRVRGHTLLWYHALPNWVTASVDASNAEQVLKQHIDTVVGRYRGRMESWDVVNEAIDPGHTNRPDAMSPSHWLDVLGADYAATAFKLARAADPDVLLVYNENHLEYDASQFDRKREVTLKFLQQLQQAGAPVGALGVQAHLDAADRRFNSQKFRNYLRDIAGLGLKVIVSELDVRDDKLGGSPADRDQAVASTYADFLGAALDEKAVIGVVTWGLSDRYTWLTRDHHRDDGQAMRPLPLDTALQPTPAYEAIGRAFDAAPTRA